MNRNRHCLSSKGGRGRLSDAAKLLLSGNVGMRELADNVQVTVYNLCSRIYAALLWSIPQRDTLARTLRLETRSYAERCREEMTFHPVIRANSDQTVISKTKEIYLDCTRT